MYMYSTCPYNSRYEAKRGIFQIASYTTGDGNDVLQT